MGPNNSTSISIEVFNETKNIYQSGDHVQGTIIFKDNHLKYKYENVLIELIGELVYTNYQKKGKAIIITTNQIPFLIQKQILHSENEKFSFYLSRNIPSSFEQNHFQGPFIHYFIRIQYLLNQFKKDFPVLVQHRLQQIKSFPLTIEKNHHQKSIHMNVNVKDNLVFIGEDLPIDIHVHNPNHLTIQRISLILIQLRKLGPSKEERTVLLKENLKHFSQFKNEYYQEKFLINIPHHFIPSCSYSIPFKSLQWLIFVHYEIYLKLHMTGFNNKITLTIPLIINKKTEITSQPPSYESIISNLNQSYL